MVEMHDELPEEEIEAAEAVSGAVGDHGHDGVAGVDGTLADHLRTVHDLDADPALSAATQEGLHDRLHGEAEVVRRLTAGRVPGGPDLPEKSADDLDRRVPAGRCWPAG